MRKLILCTLAAVTIWACKSSSTDPVSPAGGGSFFPLTIGSTWTYNTWNTDSLSLKVPGSDAVELNGHPASAA